MPATVVIFSCHILRFSISLKYSASTEKSPQPGHQVGMVGGDFFFGQAFAFVSRGQGRGDGRNVAGAVGNFSSLSSWFLNY